MLTESLIRTAAAVASTALVAAAPSAPSGGRAPAFHAIAYVNDSRSHGAVGDGVLSLEEAILLHNGQLRLAALSQAEAAQVSLIPGTGGTTDVTWIDIDGTSTPVITIERDLSPILDTSFGLLIKGFNEPPVLDFSGANVTAGFVVPANSMAFDDLILRGGPFGIDITQTDVSGQAGATCNNVRFEGQASFGLRVRATTNGGVGRVILEDCVFENVPRAVVCDESGSGRTSIFEARNLLMRGVARGLDVTLGPTGSGRYTLDRLDIEATASGLRLQRPGGADRFVAVESTAVRVRAPLGADFAASPTGATVATLRMWDVEAPAPRGTALALGAGGQLVAGELQDCRFAGDVAVSVGAGPTPLAVSNLRCEGGTVDLFASTARPAPLKTSRFDGSRVVVHGPGGLDFRGCCFVGGSLESAAQATVTTVDSYVGTTVVGAVQQTGSLPAEQLGSMTIRPENVRVGGTVTLEADLPSGLVGFFVLGPTEPDPVLLPRLHLYTVPSATLALPGSYRGGQALTIQVPNLFYLAGLEFTAQMAVVPDPGVTAPRIQLPPGRRFVLR